MTRCLALTSVQAKRGGEAAPLKAMSDRDNNPAVNMPEKVPGHPMNPESLTILFLHSSGQWVGTDASKLMLYQVDEKQIGLGYRDGETFRSFILFPGKLSPVEEKTLVVP